MATSVYQRGTNGNLSMLEKSLERRRVNKEHNSNFRAGHVPVHEEHLHKTGLRGRKRYFAYCFLALLYITAIGNLAVTALVIWVLQLDHNGLPSLQFLRGGLVRFSQETNAEKIKSSNGHIGSFLGRDMQISAQNASVHIGAGSSLKTSVEVKVGETVMRGHKGLKVINPLSGAVIFHTDKDKEVIAPTSAYTLQSLQITSPQIVSSAKEDLVIQSEAPVGLHGSEAVNVFAKQLNFKAQDISIESRSTLILDGSGGLYLNSTLIPKAARGVINRPRASVYKLCVCKTSGRIFQVPVQSNIQHPCANLESTVALCKDQ
ncbi:beta-sarcoglycan-like [Asterias rubens]|uniref:beta-sarcoglycan-like n=1 Tax=Asterias rubens TaxID=7604 RepID=UPI0014552716|nr:beta-sarcoglycan-like [Asterias rubens]